MIKKRIIVRADSSLKIGLGHIKRCLLLCSRLNNIDNTLDIIFLVRNLDGNINDEILKNGFDYKILNSDDITECINIINRLNASFLIVDSYEIDLVQENKLLENTNCKILFFDDMIKKHNCHIVLNHGIQINKKFYKGLLSFNTQLFCGSDYTLLRDEFFQKYNKKYIKNKIAIILGGNDVLNLSAKIAYYLKRINNKFKITVITSSSNPNIKILKSKKYINLKTDISNVAEVLSQNQYIITASGGSIFEVISLKKKFINIQVASNQKTIVDYLEKKKIYTTIASNELNKKILKEKLEYIKNNDYYNKLKFKYSKTALAKKILKELK